MHQPSSEVLKKFIHDINNSREIMNLLIDVMKNEYERGEVTPKTIENLEKVFVRYQTQWEAFRKDILVK